MLTVRYIRYIVWMAHPAYTQPGAQTEDDTVYTLGLTKT